MPGTLLAARATASASATGLTAVRPLFGRPLFGLELAAGVGACEGVSMTIMSLAPGQRRARCTVCDYGRGWRRDACHDRGRYYAWTSLDAWLAGRLILWEVE